MSDRGRAWSVFALAMLLVMAAGFGLRHGSNILDYPDVRDERLMQAPIVQIVEKGWSVETALDYQEVKGPAFFWPYALAAKLLGHEMNDLRLITVLFFIGGAIPLLLIMMRCGSRGPALIVAASLYVLLPYNAMVGQLLMSEASFIFIAMWLMWVFVWGFGDSPQAEKRVLGPLLFGVLLAVLLHHRPHAVAFAGAAALVSLERDGLRSWPWWLACLLAGLSRLPLWAHWGGLVTSDYQELFTLGLRLQPATYLLAASVPLLWVFIWPALLDPAQRARRWWVVIGAAAGFLLALIARPDVNAMVHYLHPGLGEMKHQQAWAGIITTALRTLVPHGLPHVAAMIGLATLGGAAIGALGAITWSRSIIGDGRGAVCRLAFWTLLVGIGLFMLTGGPVYDRYLQVWAVLLPAYWVWAVPRPILIAHIAMLAAMAGHLVVEWLF